jgi:hypothetical protein
MPSSGLNVTFTHGAPDRDLITVQASSGANGVQCVGNVVAGISRLVNFAYFVRLSAAGTQATTAAAYVVDMAARRVLAQCDVTLPSSASASFTLVTTNFTSSSSTSSGGWPSLVPTKSYWLSFCFATSSASTKRSIGSFSLGGSGNASSSSITVGACSGGPSCEPTTESISTGGSLATTLSNIAGAGNTQSSGSGGDSGASVGIAAGVTVGVAAVLVAAVVCAAVFLVRRARIQPPAILRRSSRRASFSSANSPMCDMSAPGCRVTLKQMNDLYAPGTEGFADA